MRDIKKSTHILILSVFFFLLKQFGLSRSSMTKKSGMKLWQWHCRNRREKKFILVGFWQCHCRNWGKKKKKLVGMNLWQWHYWNRMKKNFVAIGLWQWHCRNRGEITKSTHILILSIFFFTEIIWFVTFFYGKSNLQNRPYFKYIDYACCKPKKKKST